MRLRSHSCSIVAPIVAPIVALIVAGCSSGPAAPSGSEMLPELKAALDPKPAGGYQAILPIVRALAPGADSEYCTWTDVVTDGAIDMRQVQGYQTLSGHHIVIYWTTVRQPPGTTRLCTEDDMATFRLGATVA